MDIEMTAILFQVTFSAKLCPQTLRSMKYFSSDLLWVFLDQVFLRTIHKNVRLSESPSHGLPVLIYDKNCSGSKSYFNFTEEFLNQEKTMESAA